jgi:hypothetical protein
MGMPLPLDNAVWSINGVDVAYGSSTSIDWMTLNSHGLDVGGSITISVANDFYDDPFMTTPWTDTTSTTITATASSIPPTADAGGDYTLDALGSSVSDLYLNGTGSMNVLPGALTYEWDILANGINDATGAPGFDYSGPTPTISGDELVSIFGFDVNSTYSVELTVREGAQSATDTADISVGAPAVSIMFVDSDMAEVKSGDTPNPGSLQITRTGPTTSALALSITFGTGEGFAVNGTDFNTISSAQSFGAGQNTIDIPINVINNLTVDGEKLVSVSIDIPTGGEFQLMQASAQASIVDNDRWDWDAPSAVPNFAGGGGYYSEHDSWSDGSTIDMYGQIDVQPSNVSADMFGMFHEDNFLGTGSFYQVNDSLSLAFDFDPVTGNIFLQSGSAYPYGSVNKVNGDLSGGIGWDYAVDTSDYHKVTVNIGITTIAGGTITWTAGGGITGGTEALQGNVSFSVSATESWTKQLDKAFSTTLKVKVFED